MTLLVRDEIEIVEANILFHLEQGVDEVVVIDNGSVDGTRAVLEALSKFNPITIIDEPGRDFEQGRWVTQAALYARDALGADWVLNNDADEFWLSRHGSLKQVIADNNNSDLMRAPRKNMVTGCEFSEVLPWYSQLTCRVTNPVKRPVITDIYTDQLPCPYFYLDLPPKALVRTRNLVEVAQGNHRAAFETRAIIVDVPIDIFHFPIRSKQQFAKKIVQGGAAYENNTRLDERVGWHWRRWYRLLCEQGIDAALKDALPSASALAADLENGIATEDKRFTAIANRTFAGMIR